jgi:hypothetical protein
MGCLSCSWVTGRCCPLAARGYSRDGKKGLPQIEYGLLTDPAGRPVAVRVFPGNTADPTAFTAIVQAVKDTFKLKDMVMVGDRGMITSARVQELRELGGLGWVTALRAPAIAALAAPPMTGPCRCPCSTRSTSPRSPTPTPGERLVACRNPALAIERARRRLALLEATDTELKKITAAVDAGRLTGAANIGIRVGKVIGRYKMAKHYTLDITNTTFAFTRDTQAITSLARVLYETHVLPAPPIHRRGNGPDNLESRLAVVGAPDPPRHAGLRARQTGTRQGVLDA